MKLNPLYKKLMALLIVLGPAYWLIMTPDGQRRSDAFLLELMGRETIDFNLKVLDSRFTRDQLKQVFAELPWQCEDNDTAFGDSLCASSLGAFNGIPAHYITVFFVGEGINAVKVAYRDRYHEQMLAQLRRHLGPAAPAPGGDAPSGAADSVVRWLTDGGMVLTQKQPAAGEGSVILWLSLTHDNRRPPVS